MPQVLTFLGLLVGLLALLALRTWRRARVGSKRYGCQDPPRRKAVDFIFGIDKKWRDLKVDQTHSVLPTETKFHRELGNTWRDTTIFGSLIHTAAEQNIQAVLSTNAKDWGIQSFRYDGMKYFCGDGVLTTDGETWRHSRALLKPSFHKANISDLSRFESTFQKFLRQLPQDGSTVDLQSALDPVFMDTASEFILGKSLGLVHKEDSSSTPISGSTFLEHFRASTRGAGASIFLGPFRILLPKSISTIHWDATHRYIEQSINMERTEPKTSQSSLNRSLLQGVLQQTKDTKEIRDQLAQAFLGAMYNMSKYQAKMFGPESLTMEEVEKSSLVRNIVKESLRIHPVFALMARDAILDTVLPTGGGSNCTQPIFVPAGTRIYSNFWELHRVKSVFGEDVESFNPDRWNYIQPGPWRYLPFGGGPRRCVAYQEAFVEASCALIRLAQAYERIESRDESEFSAELRFVARNVNGCKVGMIPA